MNGSRENTQQHLIGGVIGGSASTALLYPLELVKTRMQVMGGQNVVYRSFTRSVANILKTEGPRGFFQGLSPAIFASSGSWGGYLYFYELSKERKRNSNYHLTGSSELTSTDNFLAGIEAGVILVFLFNPFWVVKTRLALQGAETSTLSKYGGMTDALRTIYREEGINGLYKGIVPALLLTSHGAIQFATYEKLKVIASSMRDHDQRDSQPAYMSGLLAGISKIVASIATYPYQVVKSRLQQRENSIHERRYKGLIDCVSQIWQKEKMAGFFRGLVPNVVKVVPQSALTILVYEECLKAMRSPVLTSLVEK